MFPEEWQCSHHLLLLCFLDEKVSLEIFLSIAELLCAKLEKTKIQLLTVTDEKCELYLIDRAFKFKSFTPTLSVYRNYFSLIETIKQHSFNIAIVLTTPAQSPFSLAYLCYLAGIPIRVGQSQEFGGGVLSHCIQPPVTPVSTLDYNLHLLHAAGLSELKPPEPAIA